jgi:hypothetical protein
MASTLPPYDAPPPPSHLNDEKEERKEEDDKKEDEKQEEEEKKEEEEEDGDVNADVELYDAHALSEEEGMWQEWVADDPPSCWFEDKVRGAAFEDAFKQVDFFINFYYFFFFFFFFFSFERIEFQITPLLNSPYYSFFISIYNFPSTSPFILFFSLSNFIKYINFYIIYLL